MRSPDARKQRAVGGVAMKGMAAPNPLRRHGLPVAGLAAVALAACDCGSNAGSQRVAHVASSSANTSSSPSSSASSHDPLAFSRCMRAHGVTDFPDSGGPIQASPGSDMDPNNPTYQAASQPRQSLLLTATLAQAAQAFANGLKRRHGITNFPDPHGGPGGRGGVDLRGRGIDLNSTQFQAAQGAAGRRGAAGRGLPRLALKQQPGQPELRRPAPEIRPVPEPARHPRAVAERPHQLPPCTDARSFKRVSAQACRQYAPSAGTGPSPNL
jgi:hypothetical protein